MVGTLPNYAISFPKLFFITSLPAIVRRDTVNVLLIVPSGKYFQ